MTKDYFIELAGYNVWANAQACSWLENITDEQWEQPVVSSFGNIAATVIHIANAEKIWVDRMNLVEVNKQVWLTSFSGTKKEALDLWRNASLNLGAFITGFDEKKLETDLHFTRLNGDSYVMAYYQVLAHILNHSTFHRGQIVTMLRQVGFTDITTTDITQYFRK